MLEKQDLANLQLFTAFSCFEKIYASLAGARQKRH
jgi:hypothetical protein